MTPLAVVRWPLPRIRRPYVDRWDVQDQLSDHGCVERGSEQLVEVEDGFGGQRPAASAAVETQPPVQGGELVGVELGEVKSDRTPRIGLVARA